MPVHDPNLYYRVPGKLSAGRYEEAKGAEIAPDDNRNGCVMRVTGDTAEVVFSLQVDVTGSYPLTIHGRGGTARIAGTEVSLDDSKQILLQLNAGSQKLTVTLEGKNAELHDLGFRSAMSSSHEGICNPNPG